MTEKPEEKKLKPEHFIGIGIGLGVGLVFGTLFALRGYKKDS